MIKKPTIFIILFWGYVLLLPLISHNEKSIFFFKIAITALSILHIMHEPSHLKKKWHVLNVKIPGKNNILIIKSKNLLTTLILITTFTIPYINEGGFKGLLDYFGLNFSSTSCIYSLFNKIITAAWLLAITSYLVITTRLSINTEELTTCSLRKKDNEIDRNDKQA